MASPTMVDEIGRISPTTGSSTFPLQPQLRQDPTPSSVTPPVPFLPLFPPILLRHHCHRRTRISPICPLRPANSQQILSPPGLPSIP
eukprot:scaffold60504_cov49-Cyclotella_meneghiniana.AAC.3